MESLSSKFKYLIAILALLPLAAHALPAGRVIALAGDVTALREGKEVRLEKGAMIQSGDTLQTGPVSNAQIRMTDESIIALRPQTTFKIDDYHFEGKADGKEKSLFNLVRGGFRTLTGLIGKTNQANYQVKTTQATIGIRGTHFNLLICQQDCFNKDKSQAKDGLYGGVTDGKIGVTNQTGEKQFGNDQFFHVASFGATPEGLIKPPEFLRDRLEGQTKSEKKESKESTGETGQVAIKTDARTETVEAAPQPTVTEFQINTTENKNSSGETTVITISDTSTPVFSGSGNGVLPSAGASSRFVIAEYDANNGAHNAFDSQPDNSLTTDGQGILSFYNNSGIPFNRGSASAYESGSDDGAIIWGRWANGTMQFAGWGSQTLTADQGQHIVYGVIPTSFPNQDGVAFGLIGATRPTEATNTASGNVWSVSGGSVTANFLSASFSGNLSLGLTSSLGQSNYSLNFSQNALTYNSVNGWNGTVTHTSGVQNVCGANCAANGTLIFAGTTTTHAGTVYEFSMQNSVYVQGAAVFKR